MVVKDVVEIDKDVLSGIKAYVKGVALPSEICTVESSFISYGECAVIVEIEFICKGEMCASTFILSEHMFSLMTMEEVQRIIFNYFIAVRNNKIRLCKRVVRE